MPLHRTGSQLIRELPSGANGLSHLDFNNRMLNLLVLGHFGVLMWHQAPYWNKGAESILHVPVEPDHSANRISRLGQCLHEGTRRENVRECGFESCRMSVRAPRAGQEDSCDSAR